jgi:clorobiocin biosynthesis protein CloN6
LVEIKGELGALPANYARGILSTIRETEALLAEIERAMNLDGRLPADLRAAIQAYNRKILATSSDQIVPIPRPIGGRWFDDTAVPAAIIQACQA